MRARYLPKAWDTNLPVRERISAFEEVILLRSNDMRNTTKHCKIGEQGKLDTKISVNSTIHFRI